MTPNLTIQDMDFFALDAGTSVLKTQILRILFHIKAKAVQYWSKAFKIRPIRTSLTSEIAIS